MKASEPTYGHPADVENDLRQTEIIYHKKMDRLILLIGLVIYLFFAVFNFITARYYQSLIFGLLLVNGLVGLGLGYRINDPDKLVLLKRVLSGIAFLLLTILVFVGLSGRDFFLFLPWIFPMPVAIAIMFGKRIGIYSAAAYTVIIMVLIPFANLPEWSAEAGTRIKWNAAFSLAVITGILAVAEKSRRREQRTLVTTRHEIKASEKFQREINTELEQEIALRVQSEKLLSQSERRYRSLFEESDVSLWEENWSQVKAYLDGLPRMVTEDLDAYFTENPKEFKFCVQMIRVKAVNQATLDLFHATSLKELVGNFSDIMPRKPFRTYMTGRMTALYNGGRYSKEHDSMTLDGNPLRLLVTSSLPAGFENTWAKIFTSVHDLSERVAMEEKRKRMDQQLQQAGHMQAVATLAGGIAHQFNNALSGIFGNLELIGLDPNVAASHQDRLDSLQTAAGRISALTDQLLAYARGGKYLSKAFSVNHLIEDLLDANRVGLNETIQLELGLEPATCRIKGDTTQIEMVIEAICANAVESMEEKGRLSISTRNLTIGEAEESESAPYLPPGQYAVVEIQDNGAGMDNETRDRIFEPFFTTKFFGRGLGMAAAYGIVQNHGGVITVESELNKGTRVTIHLPGKESPENQNRSAA